MSSPHPIKWKQPSASRAVSVLDLVCLLGNLQRGAAQTASGGNELGFEDATQTLEQITAKLSLKVTILESDLESALWSCNLLSERRRFWHPKGLKFDEFLRRILAPGEAFDKQYNLIVKEKK